MSTNQLKVFIAGSKRLSKQRDMFRAVLMKLQSLFDVTIQAMTYEDFSDAVVSGGQQKTLYNKYISSEADIVVFVLDGRIGVYTKQEFDVAYKSYMQRKYPKIFIYCKMDNNGTDTNIVEFKKDLDSKQQYYTEYTDTKHLEEVFKNSITDYLVKTLLKKPKTQLHFSLDKEPGERGKGADMSLGRKKLSQRLSDIFSANNLSDAIVAYGGVINEIIKLINKVDSRISDSLAELNYVKDFRNHDLQRSRLSNVTSSIEERVQECKKLDKLLLQLGLLLCYFYLEEPILVNKTLDEIKSIKITPSTWDEYGGIVKGAGLVIASGVASLFGMTPAVLGYSLKAGYDANETHKKDVSKYIKCYTSLHKMISSISFG
ncbi:MAG: hypothetical protein IJ940_09415 [Bacteroidales bacterium]|nr:hypothetical protein [Bacteroidales bacterium]